MFHRITAAAQTTRRAWLRRLLFASGVAALAAVVAAHVAPSAAAPSLPEGFTDSVVLGGLTLPTVMAFSPDGRVFVGEKGGLIKVFDSLADPEASVFADLRTQVYDYGDRGLLGLALDPGFPAKPYVYVLYTRDALIGGAAPRWGTSGSTGDPCPMAEDVGCTASGRLSRLRASGNTAAGAEEVLVDGWFQQFNSHSMGAIAFGSDGALYASGGDAASWQFVDYGQAGDPAGDPPLEGGALRAQDLQTDGDPVGLSGTVIRVNRDTGASLPDNPLSWHSDPNARRIVGYGLRNPFRIVVRPNTRELWVGDVGWREYEELNLVPDPSAAVVPNFGWPCYDGTLRQGGYDAANLPICERLYASTGAVTFAQFQYRENYPVVSGEICANTDQSMSGLAFYEGGSYPAAFDGALFFGDFTRRCIWAMPAGSDGRPVPSGRAVFVANAAYPVDLKIGPGGDLFYLDILGGAIHRIQYVMGGSEAPVAAIDASASSGPTPLLVNFNGNRSFDPDGGGVTYAWDLDGDGAFDDSVSAAPSHTYSTSGTFRVSLRVTDDEGLTDVTTMSIAAGNTRPTAVIDTPATTLRWRAGQSVSFSGHASDAEDGTLPASRLSWSVLLNHCSTATSCHQHPLRDYAGVAGGTFTAPDHEYPSFLTVRLTAIDSGGLSHLVERRLDPAAVVLTFASSPPGLQVALGGETFTTPATRTVIEGSRLTLSASSPQTVGGVSYSFASWSDGLAATHLIAADAAKTYTATFTASQLPSPWLSEDVGAVGATGKASYSGGTFTVAGAGADVWGTADAFRYVYQTMAGDGEIVARVAGLSGAEDWTKVGVMMRGSLAPDSAHAFMLVSKTKGLAFQRRPAIGASSVHTFAGGGTAPAWVKLARVGAVITASVSADGASWRMVGSSAVALPSTMLVGLAVSSHTTTTTAAGTFDRVAVTSALALPDGWSGGDVGAVGQAGSASESGGVFTVRGAGADVWGTSDAFHFVSRALNGNGQIVARVAAIAGTEAWTKVGIMIRESTAAGSPHAFMLVSSTRGIAFQRRTVAGGPSTNAGAAGSAPRWIRLVRAGSTITGSVSPDGVSWTTVGSDSFTMGASVRIGLAVSSHTTDRTASGTFDHVTVSATASRLPTGTSTADIGAVGRTGSAAASGGVFTLTGSGADIWHTADAFRFVYVPLSGDGEIVARVASLEGADPWSKAGVMIREALTPGSAHASMFVSAAKGTAFQRRPAAGALSLHTAGAPVGAPGWVRLVRRGQAITASLSLDGSTWTVVGSQTFSMGAAAYVGLAVTSHDNTALATAQFDGIVLKD
jgi:glucose/arabinose dehydrogenase/regulation of enolase protein 1 (concanavalin A-like superfamily)